MTERHIHVHLHRIIQDAKSSKSVPSMTREEIERELQTRSIAGGTLTHSRKAELERRLEQLSKAEKDASHQDAHIGFSKLKGELAHRKGVTNPGALAAYIGRKKYGAAGMAKKSAAGRK